MNIIQKIKLNNPEKENLQNTLYEIDTLSKDGRGFKNRENRTPKRYKRISKRLFRLRSPSKTYLTRLCKSKR